MKKQMFLQYVTRGALAAILATTGSAALAATASASATVIIPITITKAADLAFGKFAPGAGGTITVDTSGARTASGVVLSTVGSSPTAARFDVAGENNATYAITLTPPTDLVSGSDTMAFTGFSEVGSAATGATSGNAATGTLSGSGAQSIFIGGSLAVASNQPAGSYAGTITCTVEYN